MFATMGYVKGNVAVATDGLLKKFDGKKVITTVIEEEKVPPMSFANDKDVEKISDALINRNIEAYRELAK